MTTKIMIESAWAEGMGQSLYHLDSDARKITGRLEKLRIIAKLCSIVFNKTCINIYT